MTTGVSDRRLISARLPHEIHDGETCYRVERAWPRGTDHALLELVPDTEAALGTGVALDTGAAVGAAGAARAVAAQWFADPADLEAAATKTPAPGHVVDGVLLQPDGADARLPALADVVGGPGARLVAHRPGRRAVVRVAGDHVEFVKVVRPAKAPGLARRGRLVKDLLGDAVVVPELLDEDGIDAGVLRWSDVGGVTLHDLGADAAPPASQVRDAWELAGRALSRLHDADSSRVPEQHTAEDELTAIGAWLGPAVHHGLLDPRQVERATALVARGLRAGPDVPRLGVLHRDLHDKQLLLRPDGRLGLIDVDTLAVGERALDVANVLVHLELRVGQGLLSPERAAEARTGLLAGLGETDERLWNRVPAYAAATRLRLAGVYAFRPRWHSLACELLTRLIS